MTDSGSAQDHPEDGDEEEDLELEQEDEDEVEDEDEGEEEEEQEQEERDPPSIGETVDGRVLVCQGDDAPEYFVGWLEWSVERFQQLGEIAAKHDLDAGDSGIDFDRGVMDFLTDAGVDFDSTHWEGSCTSGIYQMGWVDAKKVDAVEQTIDDMLDAAERAMHARLLERLRDGFEEAVSHTDLAELLEFKETNALDLKAEVARLREENLALKLEASKLRTQGARRPSTRSRAKKPPDQAP
ncbi:MAG: hypothetical protein ACKO0W_10490 [Planctomycetota bacterium]